jgi:exopolysaccharide production protein ExoZ
VIGAYLAVPSFGKPAFHDPGVILSSILLVHFRTDIVILYVAWTLYHEVMFYAVFALLILDQRTGMVALVAWLLASLVALATQPQSSWVFWCSPLNLLFAVGMGVAWRMRRGRLPFATSIAAGGVLLFVCVGIDEVYLGAVSRGAGSMLYGLGAAMALAGLVSLEQAGHIRTPSVLRLIGDASYSIYLVHLPVLSLLAKSDLQMRVAAAVTPTASFMLMTVLAVLPGIGVHLWVERPLLRLLSVRRRTPAVAVAT